MSKDGGPAANSFTNPTKTGWLTKHGGHGFGANWKKRWFVLDNNYLFYYKGQNDKKPVGVVCLNDYQGCRKASPKDSKKSQFTFILEKREDGDDSGRNYYIFGESEDDMMGWIRTLHKEIQGCSPPASPSPSSRPSPSLSAKGKAKAKGKHQNVKKPGDVVDERAFDELTLKVESETPKLTHLTAERPRVRNRRPPRKYATFHEDDTKEDGEESASPLPPKKTNSPTSVAPPQPTATPQESPSLAVKRGHHPLTPIKPKPRTTTANDTSAPQDQSPKETRSATAVKPTPPPASAKPSKAPLQQEEVQEEVKKSPPQPPVKPKSTKQEDTVKKTPPLPPTKPKPTSAQGEEATSKTEEEKEEKQVQLPPVPAAKPVAKKRVSKPAITEKVDDESHQDKQSLTPEVTPPPLLGERQNENSISSPALQHEPLDQRQAEREPKAEEKEEKFDKEVAQKPHPNEPLSPSDEPAMPVKQTPEKTVSATLRKFDKPPPPRKPRGQSSGAPSNQLSPTHTQKPTPKPRLRSGSNMSTKSDDKVESMEEKKEVEDKKDTAEADNEAVKVEPKKVEEQGDGNKDLEKKEAEMAKFEGKQIAAEAATVVVAAAVSDEVTSEKIPKEILSDDIVSPEKAQEKVTKQTVDEERKHEQTVTLPEAEQRMEEKEETEKEDVNQVTENMEVVGSQVEVEEVSVSENSNHAPEDRGVEHEQTQREEAVDGKKRESVTSASGAINEEVESQDSGLDKASSRRISYENVVLNVANDGTVKLSAQEEEQAEESKDNKIELDEEEEQSSKEETPSKTPDRLSIHSSGAMSNQSVPECLPLSPISSDEYEKMQPAPQPVLTSPSVLSSPHSHVSHASEEYEDMRHWGSSTSISRQPSTPSSQQEYELVDSGITRLPEGNSSNDLLYDVPRPLANSNQQSVSPHTQKKELEGVLEEAPDVPPFIPASGSVSSAGSSTLHDRTSSAASSYGPPPERDSFGYAKINKKKSNNSEDPTGWLANQAAVMEGQLPDSTSVTLQQAREILRLARIAKMEAEEMKREAERELQLAKRDRHDAGLLKKNATEILKIAKEKLQDHR